MEECHIYTGWCDYQKGKENLMLIYLGILILGFVAGWYACFYATFGGHGGRIG